MVYCVTLDLIEGYQHFQSSSDTGTPYLTLKYEPHCDWISASEIEYQLRLV